MCHTWNKEKRLREEFIMRKKYGNGGKTLTPAQKKLPDALKKKILMAKGKKKKPGEKSPIAKMVRT